MNTQEIEKKAAKLFYSFDGVFARDHLPSARKRNMILIHNTDTGNLPGQHWVAVIIRRKVGYCFDPLGQAPSTTLSNWMNVHCNRWSSNTSRQVQPLYSNLCGYYCLYYLYWCTKCEMIDFNTMLNTVFPITHSLESYENTIKEFKKTL